MSGSGTLKRWIFALGLVSFFLVSGAAGQGPLGPPAATLTLETTSIAAGGGISWGAGVLTVDGVEHRFKVSGLTVADVGVSKVTATGEVWGLADLSQFNGTYYGTDVGVAVGGGVAGMAMRNQNGVYIKLSASQAGLKFSIASKGTTLELE